MNVTDQMLSSDARVFQYCNHQNAMPLPEWGDLAQWRRRRKDIRRHLLLCAGLNAQTAAFKARGRVVRRFRHEGITVENLCIETLPGLYVVGNLYLPSSRGAVPLILHPHGHAMYARTRPLDMYSVPHRAMNSALLGCAAFAYSMIGYDDDTMQLEHRSLLSGPEKGIANVLGLSMFGLQLNNSIKGLDYLLSRQDIDARRVGCTGESGGGTQTYFLAAVDERVKVAAPAVMLSGHFQGGCVCENAPQLHLQYGNLEYSGLIAPRPLLLTGCTGDWTHHAREREFPAMQRLYELYGARQKIDIFYQDEIHNYNRASREAVYAWMVRWLLSDGRSVGRKRIPESSAPVPSTADLLVLPAGVPPYKGAISTQKQLIGTWRSLHSRAGSAADIADVLPFDVPDVADILIRSQPSRRTYRQRGEGLHTIKYGRFSHSSAVECRFLPPKRGHGTLLVLRHVRDADAWRRFCSRPPSVLRAAMAEGWGVLVPLLFGQSGSAESQAFTERADSYLASTYTPTADALRADDILTTVRLAQVEMGIRPATVTAVADRGMSLLAWAAWAQLTSRGKAGRLVTDLGGADLTAPATWVRRCYIPLLLGVGGARGLSQLAPALTGSISGLRSPQRKLLPGTVRRMTTRRSFQSLLGEALT
ncbi:MAG TPA: hypothetical protein QGF95_07740 [Candidatus Latescibacteria bacterium]|jgi:hypothetical protein|nr:hypothetical protein [Candidatus Latescibacterota bacterium]HJP30430.1 hypothetical protein [Candidatus Latescibacterota bacterium]